MLLQEFQRIIAMKESDSSVSAPENQLWSSKKQSYKNVIFNLLSEKLEAIVINKEQLTKRLNYVVEIKIQQNKPRNGANSFQKTFPDSPIIENFSKTKLNDNDKSWSSKKLQLYVWQSSLWIYDRNGSC